MFKQVVKKSSSNDQKNTKNKENVQNKPVCSLSCTIFYISKFS